MGLAEGGDQLVAQELFGDYEGLVTGPELGGRAGEEVLLVLLGLADVCVLEGVDMREEGN